MGEKKIKNTWIVNNSVNFLDKTKKFIFCSWISLILELLLFIAASIIVGGVVSENRKVVVAGAGSVLILSLLMIIFSITAIVFLVKALLATTRYLDDVLSLDERERKPIASWIKRVNSLKLSLVVKAVILVLNIVIRMVFAQQPEGWANLSMIINFGASIWMWIVYSGLNKTRLSAQSL